MRFSPIACAALALAIPLAGSAAALEGTKLHQAIQSADPEAIRILIDSGTNLEEPDSYGRTPLYLAARQGDLELARELLERGADPNAKNLAGLTPLHAATANGHGDMVRLLLDNCASVNTRDRQRRTPLHLAAARGHIGIARELVYSNAALEARLAGGLTPFETAISNRQPETREFLRTQLPPIPIEPDENSAQSVDAGATDELGLPIAQPQVDPAVSDLGPAAPVQAPTAATLRPERPRGTQETLRFVQEKLSELGYDPGPVSGTRSAQTSNAVRAFQEASRVVRASEREQVTSCLVDRLMAASIRSTLEGTTALEGAGRAADRDGFANPRGF